MREPKCERQQRKLSALIRAGQAEGEEGEKVTLTIMRCRRLAASQFTQEEIGDDLVTLQSLSHDKIVACTRYIFF